MEASSVTYQRRRQRYALIEALIELAVAGCRALERAIAARTERQRRAQIRLDLHGLSDHTLRDIGLHRSQIDRLYD